MIRPIARDESEVSSARLETTSPSKSLFVISGALLLLSVQLLVGTKPLFALMVFAGLIVSYATVMILGGWRSLSGFCLAMLCLKFLVISQLAKAAFGEAGDSNLDAPFVTIEAFLTGLIALMFAAIVCRLVPRGRPVMTAEWHEESLRFSALVSMSLGLTSFLVIALAGGIRIGGVFGVLKQFLFFQELAVAFGTAWTIQRSRGKRLFSWLNGLPFAVQFGMGFVNAGRLEMLEPVILVVLTAVAYRFHFRLAHFAVALVFGLIGYSFVIPFGALARTEIRDPDFHRTLTLTGTFLEDNFVSIRGWRDFYRRYHDTLEHTGFSYFNHPNGTLDRLSLIKPMDTLVAATLAHGESGWDTVAHGFEMLPPRILYPDKPAIGTGTYLGLKAGMLAEDDEGTQVSFGFIADAFSSFGWTGVAIIPFCIGLGFFLVYRKLAGPLKGNVWCVVMMSHFQHYFAETNIAGFILMICQQSLVFLASWLFLKFILQAEPWRALGLFSSRERLESRWGVR